MQEKAEMTEKTDMKDHRQNKKAEERRLVRHPFPPLYDENSKILILGSFPSVKSREMAFFYGHPQNRFWKLLSRLLEASFPETVPERRAFLLAHGIALWDVIASCEIHGSSDASIRNAVPNDLRKILDHAQIRQVYVNGQTAGKLYRKYQEKPLREAYGDCAKAVVLPSTSPANAAWTMDRLEEAWRVIPEQL
jgi:hypoxanthine-DNA glycosylase